MIEISYDNVMNGLNKGIHMICVCPTQLESDRLYRNAVKLWYAKGWTICNSVEQTIQYGPEGFPRVFLRFKALKTLREDSWRGFRGVFLLHPDFHPDILSSQNMRLTRQEQQMLSELSQYNERYLKQWRA